MIRARIRKHYRASRESAAFTLDVDFESGPGVCVLFGPSGSGKTLTLECIAGFTRPAEGRIVLDETVLFDGAKSVDLAPRDRHCGYVFQNYALFPHMTLRGNLEFAAERLPRLERHHRVGEMLERFRLAEVAGRRPHELSGGQRQRCSIARALLAAPRVLLLDEPARGLDQSLRSELYTTLRQVRQSFGTPVILVTHDLDECFELGDEMLVMHQGALIQHGTPRTVLQQPASVEVARLLGLYNLLPVEVRALDPSRNLSRLGYGEFELDGPYLPGRLLGDRVSLYVRPEQVTAMPRDGRPGANQIPATLERTAERAETVRLEFAGGIAVVMPRSGYERHKHSRDWVVEFPPQHVRVI
jgi:molybdate transport system ATP-binding protein